MSNKPRDYALKFAKKSWPVLPIHTVTKTNKNSLVCSCYDLDCKSPAKHPVAKFAPQGLKNATSDPAIIRDWFHSWTDFNIGIATGTVSGLVVLDIDTRHGGEAALDVLEVKNGKLPDTLWWHTGGGGRHILFRHPGGTVPNSAGRLGAGIDVRGDGGYIVAPPSRHISSGEYYLPSGLNLDTQLAELPDWLLRMVRHGAYKSEYNQKINIANLVQHQIPEGERNTSIVRLSGHLLAKKVNPQVCLDLMLAFNAARCMPPLSELEVTRAVASISHRAFTQIINKQK